MQVGFIGLGQLGSGIARNLLRAGHDVTVYNRTAAKAAALAADGAHVATRPADACRNDVVMTMLADDAALDDVAPGADGILANLPAGGIHVSMSTIGVATAERLTRAHADAGQHFVAAPVFGRPEAAAAAKLWLLTAGAPDAVARCRPLFDAVGQSTFDLGTTPSAANVVKLAGNFLIAAAIEAMGEAMALVGKAGVDPARALDVLTSTLFTAPVYKGYGAAIVQRRFEPAGFAAPLGQKDVRLTLAAAESLCVPMPIAGLLRDRFLTLMAHGGERLDWSAIGALAAKDAAAIPEA